MRAEPIRFSIRTVVTHTMIVALGVLAIVGSGNVDINPFCCPVNDPPPDPTLNVRVLPESRSATSMVTGRGCAFFPVSPAIALW